MATPRLFHMATEVDICNLALGLLGDEAAVTSIAPPNGPQSGHCSRWYPLALRKLFEEAPWAFATRRQKGVELASVDVGLYDYSHAFAVPSACVKLIALKDAQTKEPVEYEVELIESNGSRAIFTDATDVVLVYVEYIKAATVYPTYFTQALVLLLAAYLVGSVKRSDSSSEMARQLFAQYEQALSRAKNQDARQGRQPRRNEWPLSAGLKARSI